MANNGATLERARESTTRAYNLTMEVLKDTKFMEGVFEGLHAQASGAKGKTLEEIRKEHGLTH